VSFCSLAVLFLLVVFLLCSMFNRYTEFSVYCILSLILITYTHLSLILYCTVNFCLLYLTIDSHRVYSSIIHTFCRAYCSLSFSATPIITHLRSLLPSLLIMLLLLLNLVCSTSFPYHSFSPHLGHLFVIFH